MDKKYRFCSLLAAQVQACAIDVVSYLPEWNAATARSRYHLYDKEGDRNDFVAVRDAVPFKYCE